MFLWWSTLWYLSLKVLYIQFYFALLLLLQVRSQLRTFGHPTRTSHSWDALVIPVKRRPLGRCRHTLERLSLSARAALFSANISSNWGFTLKVTEMQKIPSFCCIMIAVIFTLCSLNTVTWVSFKQVRRGIGKTQYRNKYFKYDWGFFVFFFHVQNDHLKTITTSCF